MEDQEAVDMVREHLGSGATGLGVASSALTGGAPSIVKKKSSAQVLVDAALARGSTDNITALVVFL